ncbi:integration host factor, actinobacterial type [Kitasatospora sp. NPDC085895]|uniref:integration host factor, actinobacterial type n=1 Tax=Kitasatospora sp. NPDC085895 TaxID=3155057 RepID=UPI00344FF1EC
MALPPLTPDDRARALERAMEARQERSALLHALKRGHTTLAEVLERTDSVAGRIPVRRLLASLPGIGKIGAARILEESGISPTRRVQGLGPHQRTDLLTRTAPPADRP